MTDLSHLPRPKDISQQTPVSVTMPAFVWSSFIASYATATWADAYASAIAIAAQDEIIDPVWIKEREAQSQEAHDIQRSFARSLLTGRPPEPPPTAADA